MNGNVEALKNLYKELGGDPAVVENCATSVEVLNAIARHLGGADNSIINPDAINAIADVAGDAGHDTDQMRGAIERTINSIVIPDSVTTIGDYAFRNCTALKSVVIPDGVTQIGVSAFNGCTALESAVIPGSVTTIGDYAFRDVSGTLYCKFSEGAVAGAPWECTGTIVYDYNG